MGNLGFCEECRKETGYSLQKRTIIKDSGFQFTITVALCKECGAEMDLPGLLDKNIEEFDKQYRKHKGIISMEDVKRLMKKYGNNKVALSQVLGISEEMISHYVLGQIPSKEDSDSMKKAML